MTQKERLVELLKQTDKEYERQFWLPHTREYSLTDEEFDFFADYLLKNGVIVPPCKVGDTVYVNIQYLLPDGSYRTEGPVVGQVCSICFNKDGNEIEIEGDDPYFEKASIYRSSADFGNNVFLTKEAAEQALRERETK